TFALGLEVLELRARLQGAPASELRQTALLIHQFRHDKLDEGGFARLVEIIGYSPRRDRDPNTGKSPTERAYLNWLRDNTCPEWRDGKFYGQLPDEGLKPGERLPFPSGPEKRRRKAHLIRQAFSLVPDRETVDQAIRLEMLGGYYGHSSKNTVQPITIPLAVYLAWYRNAVTKIIDHDILGIPEDKTTPTPVALDLSRSLDSVRRAATERFDTAAGQEFARSTPKALASEDGDHVATVERRTSFEKRPASSLTRVERSE